MDDGKYYFVQSTNGVRIHVYEVGNPNKPTIILIHGFPDEMGIWSKQISALKSEYHILAMDMRGMGKSSQPQPNKNRYYHVSALAEDLDAVVEHAIPNKPFHIVSHDWGSGIGWYYIDQSPKKHLLKTFIPIASPNLSHMFQFIDTYAHIGNFWSRSELTKIAREQKRRSRYMYFFRTPVVSDVFFWSAAYMGGLSTRFLGVDFFKKTMQENGFPADDCYLNKRKNSELFRTASNGLRYYRANMTDLKKIKPSKRQRTTHVHMIWGEQDRYFVPGTQHHAKEYFTDESLYTEETIKGGKHWVIRQFPEKINASIRQALDVK